MIKVSHPNAHQGRAWTCGGCTAPVVDACVCCSCYAVLCSVCAALPEHTQPSGEREGKPCPASVSVVPTAEAAAQAA